MQEKTTNRLKAIFFFFGEPEIVERDHGLTLNGVRLNWKLGVWDFEIDIDSCGRIESFMIDRLEALNCD